MLGPSRLAPDRANYNAAVARSTQEQLLLNIVRARYGESPTVLQVSGIVSGYSMGSNADLEHAVPFDRYSGASLTGSAGVRYGESPTFTYVPLEGDAFARLLLAPVPADLVFYLSVSGWNPERVLSTVAERINGARNPLYSASDDITQDELRFIAIVRTLHEARSEERWAVGLELSGKEQSAAGVTFRMPLGEQTATIRDLLRLDPAAETIKVVRAPAQRSKDELAIQTSPLAMVIRMLSFQIEAPEEHVASGAAARAATHGGAPSVMRIHSSKHSPGDAFVAVLYRDYWFWIEQTDYDSKQTLSLVLFLLNLQSSAAQPSAPLITIPATR